MALDSMKIKQIDNSIYCKWMGGHGIFARMGVIGDGSCFFHSVCALMNKDNYLYLKSDQQKAIVYEFRCEFTKHFSKDDYLEHKTNASKDYETSKENFCIPKAWADEVMIKYASKILNLNLIFIDVDGNSAYCGVHGQQTIDDILSENKITQKMGLVAWVNKSHFEPIVRIDDASRGLITTIFEPSKNKEDLKFIKCLVKNYISSCNI